MFNIRGKTLKRVLRDILKSVCNLILISCALYLPQLNAASFMACRGILELEKVEKAILRRINYVNENKKLELIAMTGDLKVFKIPYDESISHLRLKPWLNEVNINRRLNGEIIDSITRNQILLVNNESKGEKFLLIGLHKETSRIFDQDSSYIPLDIYLTDLKEAIDFFEISLRGTAGFQGPEALLHLWILRTTLKMDDAKDYLAERFSWEKWHSLISSNYQYLYESIRDHAMSSRHDLREDFYLTLDQITEQLAKEISIKPTVYEKLFFEKKFTTIEARSFRIATWNLQNFYLPKSESAKDIVHGGTMHKFKSKAALKQIRKNIELVAPDFLVTTEVDISSLKSFVSTHLETAYEVISYRGNDPFHKDIALLVKKGLPVQVKVQSNKDHTYVDKEGVTHKTFSRDLPLFYIYSKKTGHLKLILAGTHNRANASNSSNINAKVKLARELVATQEIIHKLQKDYGNKVILLGDFNSDLKSPSGRLKALITSEELANSIPMGKDDHSLLNNSMNFTQALRAARNSHPRLSDENIERIAHRIMREESKINGAYFDGVFTAKAIQAFVRKAFLHRLVDSHGVVIDNANTHLRASDHNMVGIDLDMSFLSPKKTED